MIITEVCRSRFSALLSTILIAFLTTGCLPDSTAADSSSAKATVSAKAHIPESRSLPYPDVEAPTLRIQGSNTIGASLAPALAKEFLLSLGSGNVQQITGDRPNEQSITGTLPDGRPIQIHVAAHGSSTGFAALRQGEADIAASSRPIRPQEAKSLSTLGDLTSVQGEHVLGIDGLAIIVHPDNPLEKLSLEQLRQIFSGSVSDWQEIGGHPGSIEVFARDDNSGTYDTFSHLILTDGAKLTPDARRYESNDALARDVTNSPGTIGFVALASVKNAKVLGISDGEAAALKPKRIAVATEDYPLSRRLYLYTATESTNPMTADFVDYVLSNPGQKTVEKEGFISQAPRTYAVRPTENDPQNFIRLTEGARRLSLNFRFRPDSWELDTKALRDVQRLAEYIQRSKLSPSRVMLIGFSEKRRDELGAQILSEQRAAAVQKALRVKGINIAAVTGYGHYRAVASAQSIQASLRNNRVEVWIQPAPQR